MNENKLREEICTVGASLYQRGLTAGSSGNISARVDDGWLLTPTNSCLGTLDPARLSRLDWSGQLISGDPPSKEAVLHRAMYEERPHSGAIVHLHCAHAAAVSCMSGLNDKNCMPPLTAYYVMKVGKLPLAPYHRPGDPELGEAVRELARKHWSVLLANHGPVVAGKDLESALNAMEELEATAKIFLLLHWHNPRILSEDEADELRTAHYQAP
jgi:ribulose-5-phosphate 4-epimerase/fuculose-1-phosphate aldolase